jgi:hypothetical protein
MRPRRASRCSPARRTVSGKAAPKRRQGSGGTAQKAAEAPKSPEKTLSEEERKAREAQAQIEALQDTIDYIPIDDLLAVGLETYRDPEEPGRVYFRIGIQPRPDKVVPVIPKDIVWVQDVSASISEERLAFCRRGLSAALETMNPDDRFEVIAFRESFASCFPTWTAVSPESKKKADAFVSEMHSFGQTDVFGSLQSLLKLSRDPKRPMIACVVTDGKPTFGMTESAKIIGAFSKLNGGLVSVYMFGTQKSANAYLLDMLTYCNRGAATVLHGNRWDIPPSMASVYEGIRNPVMADVSVVFDSASKSEVYPRRTANLYKDRPLVLSGCVSRGDAGTGVSAPRAGGGERVRLHFPPESHAARQAGGARDQDALDAAEDVPPGGRVFARPAAADVRRDAEAEQGLRRGDSLRGRAEISGRNAACTWR